jgi:PTH1 family peptidyl-tRNA hydrolase
VKAVVGLGNPGAEYAFNRHNLGFRVVDLLAGRFDMDLMPSGDKCLTTNPDSSRDVCLCLPLTYVNESGLAVSHLLSVYKVDIADLLVVCDDVNLPFGHLRIRPGGGDGGHKGLASIIREVGREDFPRLRLGIGPGPGGDLTEFVLEDFPEDEGGVVEKMIDEAASFAELFVSKGLSVAMNECNRPEGISC